jgi:hypothetical protein
MRKQWALELEEKFNLPTQVLDAKAASRTHNVARAADPAQPRRPCSSCRNYANSLREELKAWPGIWWSSTKPTSCAMPTGRATRSGQGIRWATEDCRKLLLTATPLQNSLLELYGLSTLIDEHLFGDRELLPIAVRQRGQQS